MKHVIIGTAGHVDHGKTALVKALTGIDTDRLEEEKRRGVTIEPGFAYLDFDDGSRAGIIDVPGHERFIRNMLAGSGGVDLAMLIVAADEGVMPQTREHLGILSQLGIKDGVVVITKLDKVEDDWLELVKDDIAELTTGTFLESKEIVSISAHTGLGIDVLKKTLQHKLGSAEEKDTNKPFRLPVDRVFPVDGFGMVVTGTLIEGSINVGDIAEIQPSGEKAPVRNIQVHGENSPTAFAGQRTAISLAGIKRGNVERGDVLTAKGMLNVANAIDVKLSMLPDTQRTIKNGAELHLYHGARTLLAKAFLIDKSEIHKGESCYARLKLKEPLPCKRGDRFVIRFLSPLETIGGGIILDSMPGKRISRTEPALEAFRIREQGSDTEIANLIAYDLGRVLTEADLCRHADLDKKACKAAIEYLLVSKDILKLQQENYISTRVLENIGKECTELLGNYHRKNPLRGGMILAELRQKLLSDLSTADANAVVNTLKNNEIIKLTGNNVALPNFSIEYTETQQKIHAKLQNELSIAGYDVKTPDELSALFPKNEKREFEQIFESMISSGEAVMLSKQIFWSRDAYDKAIDLIKNHFNKNKQITLSECRDLLGTSRKYALALLEHLDGKQVTRLEGDTRKLAKGFA